MPLRSLAVIAALLATPPVLAATCEVNPYAAWQAAQARGWQFRCSFPVVPGAVLSGTLLPEPPDRIGCRYRTGPAIQIQAPVRVRLLFLAPGPSGLPHAMLRNGWRVDSYAFSPAQTIAAVATTDPAARVAARADIDRPLATLDFRLTRLVLHHPSAGCAHVLAQAF